MGHGTQWLTTTYNIYFTQIFILFCCLVTVVNAQYVWKTEAWSECRRPGCGDGGTRTRTVWCERVTLSSSQMTEDGNCHHLQKPFERQTCFKVCTEHRYQVKWATTSWSDCELEPSVKVCARGLGVRYRNVTCVWKGNGMPEDDDVCSSFELKPESKKGCDLRCSQDCVVGLFSNWNSCESCRYANKTRTRNIVVPPSNRGKDCPIFTESIPCQNCTDAYFLSVRPWSACVSFQSQTYTHPLVGHQSRDIKCINGLGALVNYRNCRDRIHLTSTLLDHQPCLIPQDCDISEWSSWRLINSSCLDVNGQTIVGTMKRIRNVLQVPRGSGKPCPALEEMTEVQGTTSRPCPRTHWKVTEWGKCKPVNGMQQCSTGLQHRKTICIEQSEDGQSKPVPNEKCTDERPLTSQTCRADCHWDCTVSLWSQWTECRVTDCEQYARKRRTNKKTGQRYRIREVLTLPGTGGQPCPHLSETQNCDPEPCYNWNLTTGKCVLRKSNGGQACGTGIAYRTFACVNKFGMRVADSLCTELHGRPDSTVDCQVSCQNDCVLSDWGQWTECPDLCQNGHILHTSIKSRRRTILARPGPGGQSCPASSVRDMQQVEDCPTVIECATYVWQTDPWEPCQLENENQKCGRGTQTREVACYDSKKQLVSDEKCTQKVKPSDAQNCEVPCPKDCTVTEFSDWSPCSATCWEGKDTVPTKMRQRYILQHPDNGGAACPELLKEVQQCQDLPFCHGFHWDTTDWSQCVLAPTVKKCGTGIKAREVACKSDNGTTHSIDTCLRYVGTMPKMSESCSVSCEATCTFTIWESWSTCIGGCNGKRFRSRTLVNEDTAPSECRIQAINPQYEQEPCLCTDLSPILLGDWSQCILEPLDRTSIIPSHISRHALRQTRNASAEHDSTCGTGIRYKVVACKNEKNTIETASKCQVAQYKEDVCMIPCPVDCVMSEWSTWTLCPSSCGAGVQERFRHIQRFPSAGGRRCPSLESTPKINYEKDIQTRLCHPECTEYVWHTFDWSMCIPKDGAKCGEGNQTRHVRCHMVNANGHTTGTAGEHLCNARVRPPNTRSCTMPCLGECVVSEWTEWTHCNQPCNLNQQQQRRRKVMREPTIFSPGSNDCPRLLEMQPCRRGNNCMEYSYELSSWQTCLVNNGLDNCGVGHKERYAICKNHFGLVVNKRNCERVLGPVTEPLVVSCEIPCDVDCLLSDWTPWTSCSKSCGLGEKTRDRFIVQQFLGNGRPCPSSLTQTKPCFLQGCYTWNVSEWSPCATQRGLCGHGMQSRAISCIGEDMLPTHPSQCTPDLNVLVMQTERPCHVPCPGECIMTEWTKWNRCFVTCEDYHTGYKRGVQSRSRTVLAHANTKNEPCPSRLWESKGCDAEYCMVFKWRTGPWQAAGDRAVWCERSDGLQVKGGCPEVVKPASILMCDPPCDSVPQSYCNDTDTCSCFDNFYPRYNGNVLVECSEENSTVVTGAQETASESGADGPRNIWMYAVVAAATIFCIFVALALYNMSELFRTGPRPRSRDDEDDEEDQLDPGFKSSTPNQSHLDGLNALDNCNVCKQMPAPPDGHSLHEGHSTMETICNETVGACMKVLVCNSSKHDSMHDDSDTCFVAEHVAMETYACVHRPLESCMESPVDKAATITSAPRPRPISATIALKHSQSDSAISIPTGSVGSTCKNSKKSISVSSNYSTPREPKKQKYVVTKDNSCDKESELAKFPITPESSRQNSDNNESASSERGSVCLDDVEAGHLIESVVSNGSLEFFVQDYFQKIGSLPKSDNYENLEKVDNIDVKSSNKSLCLPNDDGIALNRDGCYGNSVECTSDLNGENIVVLENFNAGYINLDPKYKLPDPSAHLPIESKNSLVSNGSPALVHVQNCPPDVRTNRLSNGDEYRLTYLDDDSNSSANNVPKANILDINCYDSVGSCSDLNTSDPLNVLSKMRATDDNLNFIPLDQRIKAKPSLMRQKNFIDDAEIIEPLLLMSDNDDNSLSGIAETEELNIENGNIGLPFPVGNGSADDLEHESLLYSDAKLRKESTV